MLAAMRTRLQRLNDQMEKLARSREALVDYIDAAEKVAGENYPPFDGSDLQQIPA
ncbi:hypothetical protein AB0H34_00740 [Saccharopolyspora shandongensis]|uniref:hypothetical protein n=1 Tax=Saccharopolyspora shandongensis TaxID=418495 RepID=UPI0033C27FB1